MTEKNNWLIELASEETWVVDSLRNSNIPSPIVSKYLELYELVREGNVYGTLLQLRDLYETIVKMPVLMAFIICYRKEKEEGEEDNDSKAMDALVEKLIKEPLSMGHWETLARHMRKNTSLGIPDPLVEILEHTVDLLGKKVSENVPNVIKWRNDSIGHGMLKFQDDEGYQRETRGLLDNLSWYFCGGNTDDVEANFSINDLYSSVYFMCENINLVGEIDTASLENREVVLMAEESKYDTKGIVLNDIIIPFFFDSFYSRKNEAKYVDYYSGDFFNEMNDFFVELTRRYNISKVSTDTVKKEYVSREEDEMLDCINDPGEYVKPLELVDEVRTYLRTHDKGVLLISMERGTGKSAFASKMDGLYNSEVLIKHMLSRTYHVSNAQVRGPRDFVNSFSSSFKRSVHHKKDIRESDVDQSTLQWNSKRPSLDLANELYGYHYYYEEDYTVFVVDGIDEITAETERILDFIPSADELYDGTFVILLSRFADEETVSGQSQYYIERMRSLADETIDIRHDSTINISVLKKYIEKSVSDIDEEGIEEIIRAADYRMLKLKALIPLRGKTSIDTDSERSVIASYIDYVTSAYNINSKKRIHKMLAFIALFHSVSIFDVVEYLGENEITYLLIGQWNDITPLLTVKSENGVRYYEFADSEYKEWVIDELGDAVADAFKDYQREFVHYYGSVFKPLYESNEWQEGITSDSLKDLHVALAFYLNSFVSLNSVLKKHRDFCEPLLSDEFYVKMLQYLYEIEIVWKSFEGHPDLRKSDYYSVGTSILSTELQIPEHLDIALSSDSIRSSLDADVLDYFKYEVKRRTMRKWIAENLDGQILFPVIQYKWPSTRSLDYQTDSALFGRYDQALLLLEMKGRLQDYLHYLEGKMEYASLMWSELNWIRSIIKFCDALDTPELNKWKNRAVYQELSEILFGYKTRASAIIEFYNQEKPFELQNPYSGAFGEHDFKTLIASIATEDVQEKMSKRNEEALADARLVIYNTAIDRIRQNMSCDDLLPKENYIELKELLLYLSLRCWGRGKNQSPQRIEEQNQIIEKTGEMLALILDVYEEGNNDNKAISLMTCFYDKELFFVEALREYTKTETLFIECWNKIISMIERNMKKEDPVSYRLHNAYYQSIIPLVEKNDFEKAISMMECFVSEYDSAVFISYFYPYSEDLYDDDYAKAFYKKYGALSLFTPAACYLLETYRKNGRHEEAEALEEKLKNDTNSFEEWVSYDYIIDMMKDNRNKSYTCFPGGQFSQKSGEGGRDNDYC